MHAECFPHQADSEGSSSSSSDSDEDDDVKKATKAAKAQAAEAEGGRLVLANSRGQIAYVSPETGQVAGTVPTEDSYSLPPLVANNTLYLLGDSGRISAYR